MKKLLSVFLAAIMIFSSAAVIGASAADGYAAKNPITDNFSTYYEFMDENKDKEIFGYTPEFLYESNAYVDWSKLDIRFSANGLPTQSTDGSFALAFGNINAYLKRVMNSFFLGQKLYTEEYAVDLINFFGKLINPNFVPVTRAFETNVNPNDYDFFETIAVKSGLADAIQNSWCDMGVDYTAFFKVFGANVDDIVSNKRNHGKYIAKAFVEGVVGTFIGVGPLEYAFGVLENLSTSYSSTVYKAATNLFSRKIAAGKPDRKADGTVERTEYTVAELNSVDGFLTYVFDGVLDYDFFRFPGSRISAAKNRNEQQLFLYMYFAINYKYKNNSKAVDSFASKINEFFFVDGRYSKAGYSYEEISDVTKNISKIVDVVFKGNITDDSVSFIQSLLETNLEETPNDIFNQFKSWLSKIMRKIADYFDYLLKLFSGDINYGESIID